MRTLAEVSFQSNWWQVLQSDFMRNALIGGAVVAVAAGLLGYFVVIRQHAFAAHALAHIGFPGATGAILIGVPVTLGLAVFTIGGALAIGLLGRQVADREVSTGTILAFATGLGVLFNSLASRNANTITNVLFGNLLAISTDELVTFGAPQRGRDRRPRRHRAAPHLRLGRRTRGRGPRACGCGPSASSSSCCWPS